MKKLFIAILLFLALAGCATAQSLNPREFINRRRPAELNARTCQQLPAPPAKKSRQKLDWTKNHPRFNHFMHWIALSLATGGTAFDGIESKRIIEDIQQSRSGVVVICEQNGMFKAEDGCGFRQNKFFLVEGGVIGGSETIRTYFAAPADVVEISLGIVGLINGFTGRSILNNGPIIGRRK